MNALWISWCVMAWIILHAWLIAGAIGLFAIGRYIWRQIIC